MKTITKFLQTISTPETKFFAKAMIILGNLDTISTIIGVGSKGYKEVNDLTILFHQYFGVPIGQILNYLFVDIPMFLLTASLLAWYQTKYPSKISTFFVRVITLGTLMIYSIIIYNNYSIILGS